MQDIVKDVPQVQLDLREVSLLSYDQEHMGETGYNVQQTGEEANWVRNLNFLKFPVSRHATKNNHSVEMAPIHLLGGGQDQLDKTGPFHGAKEKLEKLSDTDAEDDDLGIKTRTESETEQKEQAMSYMRSKCRVEEGSVEDGGVEDEGVEDEGVEEETVEDEGLL